ncbi:hypothetical protein Droror1_Dr00020349 [Drosera rotundifolia]
MNGEGSSKGAYLDGRSCGLLVDDVGVPKKDDENVDDQLAYDEALEKGENVGVVQSLIDVANSKINESLSNLCEVGLLTIREEEDDGNEKSDEGDN